MDETGFRKHLKKNGKSSQQIEFDIRNMQVFEEYLLKHKQKKHDEVTPQDLKDFVEWADETGAKIWLWVFNRYYSYTQNNVMYCATNELMGVQSLKKTKLKDFLGVDPQHAHALKARGIATAAQMLDAGKTEQGRAVLAERAGVPPAAIFEFVKLSNLARIVGLKKKRARLYVDAGLDSLKKIAEQDPEEMRQMLIAFVDRTGFEGSAPTPGEAAHTVRLAKYLPKIVEY